MASDQPTRGVLGGSGHSYRGDSVDSSADPVKSPEKSLFLLILIFATQNTRLTDQFIYSADSHLLWDVFFSHQYNRQKKKSVFIKNKKANFKF